MDRTMLTVQEAGVQRSFPASHGQSPSPALCRRLQGREHGATPADSQITKKKKSRGSDGYYEPPGPPLVLRLCFCFPVAV
ncbi:hypothetical protein EYF80_013342 [Liparis tanakae]|uniref:Uncharacterized protein n=1 Tax=Liparis tanakae TaxID=230148 RepID=A0A4Z2IF71_9TELE|nr:hypothetical protein EYF80_013342 [Liparis tanakae]